MVITEDFSGLKKDYIKIYNITCISNTQNLNFSGKERN